MPEVEQVCLSFAASNHNIKYLVQENQGSAVARNTALDNISCDYVFFVDADDMLPEHFRENLSS